MYLFYSLLLLLLLSLFMLLLVISNSVAPPTASWQYDSSKTRCNVSIYLCPYTTVCCVRSALGLMHFFLSSVLFHYAVLL